MNCPKCDHEQADGKTECETCGIVFTKYYAWLHARQSLPEQPRGFSEENESFSFSALFFHVKPNESDWILYARAALLMGMVVWGLKFMMTSLESGGAINSYLHLVNLPFHEAGHIIFRPFGSFMTSLGGTLGQFLVPMICLGVLLVQTQDPFGACVTLWWFGQNFFDIAPYVNDARSLSLPLVGGNFGHSSPYGFHDWEYLLTELGWLRYDHVLAKGCVAMGTFIFILSFAWASLLLYKQFKNND